jgi:uncharacterized ferritin-like protein (DUF455 family)
MDDDHRWRAFAGRVLTASTLADKLRPPGDDEPAPPAGVPAVPGRPPELAFRPPGPREVPLPSPRSLASDRDRARILHAMANHELLALELFAHALLRFPDLPSAHRRAWVATMVDEQRHLGAYLDRLAASGGAVGEEPVSTFFWDALAPVHDPRSFVAGLSLCLEQANLDFARTWADAFRRVGDEPTARVLDEVHADEIRHLRAGVATFRALSEHPERPLAYADFAAALVPPLAPARARGPRVDRGGRARAGLSDAFVDELVAAGGSRGRVPRLAVLRAGAEDELAGRTARTPAALATLGAWMVAAEDLVLAPPPRAAFVAALADAGLPLPGFVAPGSPLPRVREVVAWAHTPALARELPDLVPPWDPRRVEVHGKAFAAGCARAFLADAALGARADDVGAVCRTAAEVEAAVGEGRWVVKADLSTAGGHRVWLEGPWSRAPDAARRFVARALDLGPVVVERALRVAAELSVHVDVADDEVRPRGITRFWATRGVYRGTVLGPLHLGLASPVARFLHRDGRERDAVARELGRAARSVGLRARDAGHRGPLSVDALVVGEPDQGPEALRLKPISEVNPRWTMSRLALALRDRLAPGAVGVWWFAPAPALAEAGLSAEVLAGWVPLEHRAGRPIQGFLPTSDPLDPGLTTWLVFSPRWSVVEGALARLAAASPSVAALLPGG